MKIAICEDAEQDWKRLHRQLSHIIENMDLDADITTFSSGEALLAAVDEGWVPTVCFLDVYLNQITGIDVARALKKKHPRTAIVLITSSPDHMADGFEIGAVHYLLKPASDDDVEEALHRALLVVDQQFRSVELIVNRQRCRVFLSDIIYAESQAKFCSVYLRNSDEPLRVYLRLDELEQTLSHPRFLRCHHSFIVNLDAISAPTEDGTLFLMQNGTFVPIRQRGRKETLALYNDYYFKRIRGSDS